jgi:pilus assembly protein CpaE
MDSSNLPDTPIASMPNPHIVVIEPDSPQRLYLSGLFGRANAAASLRDVPLSPPMILILGPSLSKDKKALDEIEMVLVSNPDIASILVTPGTEASPEMMRWAVRATVKDVVSYEGTPDDIRGAVDRARQILANTLQTSSLSRVAQQQEQEGAGKIIVVFSPKGGVGKSTISSNLAAEFALLKPESTVALVDANLQFGDISVMLRVTGQQNLATIMESKDRINPQTYEYACGTHKKTGLRVLVAPADPAYADTVTPAHITDVFEALRSFASITVVDTAPLINELNILILEQADHILIPVNPDLPSVKNVAIVLKTLRALGVREGQIGIVLNKSNRKNPGEQKEIEKTLDYRVVACIPDEDVVRSAVNDGTPFVLTQPKAFSTKAVAGLAGLFLPQQKSRIIPKRSK